MSENTSKVNCSDVLVNGENLFKPVSVIANSSFEVVATCPTKNIGESFELVISMNYNAVMGGISTVHTETGHIRGHVEA
jgi:hypothetical protein